MPTSSFYPHVVRLPVSRAVLGDARFERTCQACRYAARRFSQNDCLIEAVYEDYQRTGYVFSLRTGMQALRLGVYYQSVMQGRPFPLKLFL